MSGGPKLAPGSPDACDVCGWTSGVHNHVAHLQADLAPAFEAAGIDTREQWQTDLDRRDLEEGIEP